MNEQFRSKLATILRAVIAFSILSTMLFPSTGSGRVLAQQSPEGNLTVQLQFSSAPIVGRPAELVLEVSALETTEIQAEVRLPEGVALVSGDLAASGTATAASAWKHALVIKSTAQGEYKITVSVKGKTSSGMELAGSKDLYLSTNEKNAAAGEIPVKVPADAEQAPQPFSAGSDIEGATVENSQAGEEVSFAYDPSKYEGAQAPVVEDLSEARSTASQDSRQQMPVRDGLGAAPEGAVPQVLAPESISAQGIATDQAANDQIVMAPNQFEDEPLIVDRGTLDHQTLIPLVSRSSGNNSNSTQTDAGLLYGPDLIVYDIWSSTNPLMVNEWDTLVFELRNIGDISTWTTFYTRMWVGGYEMATWYSSGLPSGYYTRGSISVKVPTATVWSVVVQTDVTNNVYETYESNNTRGESWLWKSYGQDLLVWDLYSRSNPLTAGEWESVYADILNVGNTSIYTRFYTKMYFNSAWVGYWYTLSLNSGYYLSSGLSVRVPPGNYTVRFDTDTTYAIPEPSEANNTRSEIWRWAYSGNTDLTVYDIYSSTNPLVGNTAENITFMMKNLGTTPAIMSQGEAVSNLTVLGTKPGGATEVHWNDVLNTPSLIQGDLAVQGADAQSLAMNFFRTFAGLYGMQDPSQELTFNSVETDELGMEHIRYQQVYQGLPVLGGDLIVHVKDGQVALTNGSFVRDINLSVTPQIDAEQAIAVALQDAKEAGADALEKPRLVVYNQGADPILSWDVIVKLADVPTRYFIDAQTGKVLSSYSMGVEALNRITYNARSTQTFAYGSPVLVESSTGSADSIAWNAHTNIGRVYNYFKGTHSRDSIDGAGRALITNVHFGLRMNNAMYSPYYKQFAFGDGNGVSFGPFGNALDIVAHEYTHGVGNYEANLTYSRQSGALDESFADFFAAMVDRNDWTIGEDNYTPAIPGDFPRSMSNPPAGGWQAQPDNMTGFRDYSILTSCNNTNDQCGVHYNSGIPNKAAYLVSDGGTFRNINVYGIGRAKAERIYYRAYTIYLTSSSNFTDARNLLIRSAVDLYGTGSLEARAVQDAFAAVGIGSQALFYSTMYIDNVASAAWWTGYLGPYQIAYGATIRTLAPGYHTIKVVVDSSGLVAETNETNNTRAETWYWSP